MNPFGRPIISGVSGVSATIPKAYRTFYVKNIYPFVDRDGKRDGTSQLMQYASVASGTVTLYHASIVGTEAISSHGGTAAVGVVAGGITIGVGTAWNIRDNAGHIWSHCAALSATSVVMWDVGLGEHLVATGLAEAVVTALCSTGRDPLVGADRLNQRGVTVADGSQYADNSGNHIVPLGTAIPELNGCLSAASWSWVWEQMLVDNAELYVDGELAFEGV